MDAIEESPRQTLKVASVIGRTFGTDMLGGVYPELGRVDALEHNLSVLDAAELVEHTDDAANWWFRQVLTHEVAYESLPFSLRAELHGRAGAFVEGQQGADLDLLAHHYWHSGDAAKKIEYLDRAGAAAQARYANAAAIDYLERLAGLLRGPKRADALLRLGKVLALVGDWSRARETVDEASALSLANDDSVGVAWCDVALAELDRKQGHYDIAAQRLDRAREAFEDARVDDGIGQVLHLVGTLAAQRGDYDRARDAYQRSIAVRERLGDLTGIAAALSNLGVVAEYAGDYRESLAFHERALQLRHELGDRWAIAVSFTNIGMIAVHEQRFADAGMAFREAMRLNREVGDLWMVAICHNNLGNALRGVGQYDEARAEYAAAARTYRDYDDHWAMAFLLEDVALLAAEVGLREAAYELVGAADRQREELGSPRAPALETTLTERLSAAAAGDDDAHAARQRGALFDTEQAVSALMSVCVTESSPEI
jgi:tetratricopeptide (TPR) repeat protein